MYGSDKEFVVDKIAGARQILNYFNKYTDVDGSLIYLPNWFFTDWVDGWKRGMGPVGKDGSSAILDLQLLLAYQNSADLERFSGLSEMASLYEEQVKLLATTIRNKYWDNDKQVFADTPEKNAYSQHTNSLAIIAGLVSGIDAENLGNKILKDSSMAQASIYFKYYVHQALVKAGLGNDYMSWLNVWRRNIDLGLTTWAEDSDVENARSDCHAWGSSPNIEFFRKILGIDSSSPNFETVKIEPHLGSIQEISGSIPHPAGTVSVNYSLSKNRKAEIVLPNSVTGVFIWKGSIYKLKGGSNVFTIH